MINRLTLVVSGTPSHSWNRGDVLFVESLSRLPGAIATHDVERVILDRSASAEEFLYFLASHPARAVREVMLVADDGRGFLSSVGRGGDRVLYALSPTDIAFYLQTNRLAATPADLAMIA